MSYPVVYAKKTLTQDGASNGLLTVDSTSFLVQGATVFLSSATKPTQELLIDTIVNATTLFVKIKSGFTYNRFDCSGYLVADGATLTQPGDTSYIYDDPIAKIQVSENSTPKGLFEQIDFSGDVVIDASGNKALVNFLGTGNTYPEVNTFADLPLTIGNPVSDSIYVVRNSTGIWLINRKVRGLWIRTGQTGTASDWERLGDWLEAFADSNFAVFNQADNTKEVEFDVSGVSHNATRVLGIPDKNGTIALLQDIAAGGGIAIQATNTTFTSGTVTFGNANGFSFLTSNGSIVGSYTGGPGGGGIGGFAAGTQTGTSGTLNFVNSNGISFGLSGSSQLTASYTVPTQSVQTQNSVQVLGSSGNISFVNSNGVSFGGNASTITASVAAGATATGNFGAIAGGTQTATSGTVNFANSNGISFGMSGSSQITASYTVPTQTTQSYNILAAGTQTANTTGSVVFSNSNGISFGMSNSSVVTASYTVPTQTVQTVGVYGVGNTAGQSSSSTFDARTLSFNGAGIVSVGNSNGSIIISATAAGAGGIGAAAAGTQTGTSGTLNFVNSNGISFGLSGSSQLTASYTVPTQTTQTYNVVAAGTQTANTTGSVVFSNSNNVSFGMSNNSVVTASASFAQTTQSAIKGLGVSNTGNTLGNTGLSTGIDWVLAGSGGITASESTAAGGPNTIWMSVPAGASATGNFGALAGGTQTATSGTVVFANSNGISFGMSGSSQITASYTVPTQSTQTYNVIAAGTQTANTTGSVVFSNSNGISFGMSNNSVVTASYTVPSQTTQSYNILAAGTQTANTTGSVVFSNSNGVTFGMSNSSVITASIATSLTNINLSAGTTSNNLSAFVFSNSNNVSFGLNGSTVTGSASFNQTTQSAIRGLGVSNTGTTLGNTGISTGIDWVIAGSGNITASQSTVGGGPNTIWLSVPTGAAGGIANAAGTQTATSGTVVFANSNGISFGMSGSSQITASYTVPTQTTQTYNVIAAGTQTANTTGSVVFSNSNNVSFGMSNNSVITASASYSQSTAPAAISAGTTQATNGTVIFANSNGVSFGMNNGTITATVVPGAAAGLAAAQAGTQTQTSGTLNFVNSNNISFGLSGSSQLTASYNDIDNAIAAGTQTFASDASGTLIFSNSNSITFGMSNNSIITASYGDNDFNFSAGTSSIASNAGGTLVFSNSNNISFGLNGNTFTASYQVPLESMYYWQAPGQVSSSAAIATGISVNQIFIPEDISLSRVDIPVLVSLSSSGTGATGNILISSLLVIYTRNGSTLNPVFGVSGTTTHTWASNTANFSNLTGGRFFSFAKNTSLPAGLYYVGFQMSTNNNSSIGTATTQLANTVSVIFGSTVTGSLFNDLGSATASTTNVQLAGVISSLVSNTTQSLQMSQITQTGTAFNRALFNVLFRNF